MSLSRCLVFWSTATAVLLGGCWLAGAPAASLVARTTWEHSFEDLLVGVCALALVLSLGRIWLVTTATTLDVLRGRPALAGGGLTRRLVLAACGAAVVAGVSAPAMAGGGSDLDRLAGLRLPDRATAGAARAPRAHGAARPQRPPAPASTPARPREDVVVRAGDSLWSIASSHLPASADTAEVDRAWRSVYAANRAEIGADPGLIRPGQRLHLPPLTTDGDDR